MLTVGTATFRGVTVPPVQLNTRSPVSSVMPSARSCWGVAAFAKQVMPFVVCALATPVMPNKQATPAKARAYFLKSAILNSPCKFQNKTCESVEVLFQPEPQLQQLPLLPFRELLRVGRRTRLPNILKWMNSGQTKSACTFTNFTTKTS